MIDFSEKYNREEILKFLHNDFLKDFQKDIRKVNVPEGKFIKSAFSLGSSKDLDLGVFEFEHTGSTEKKVTLTKEAFKILRDSGYFKALAFFHSEDTDDWRFSLMTIIPTLTEKGKIKKEFSNPKRFSFLLGPRAKVNTPTQFLIKKGQIESLEDLKERFSIEVVNKEFYKKISELFVELVGGELGTGRSKVKYEGLLQLPGVKPASKGAQEFAVRLIGRLIFCWFLREKKNGSEDSLMPSSLLSYEASKENNDYYHEVLEPIFFKVLNVPIDSRKEEKYATDPYAQVPYLNGGLFTPHEDDYFSNIESKQKEYRKVVRVPDKWIQKLFEILETYNFTIDENSSFDEELSIDPEMLGRIFENLLAEINPETGESARKSTGSFYTPRVIVDYMVDESLYLYLGNKTKIEEEKLRALISYDLDDDAESPIQEREKEEIINAIDELKILDPACGSGAFPMGILQKIVFILQQLDPQGQLWFKRQIEGVPVELRKNLEKENKEENFDYIRKLGVIRKNIFGIDIQPIATEISRLRCFLTLVVDQKVDNSKDNRGIVPLPNLNFKFVTANSLISLPEQQNSTQTMDIFEDRESIDFLKEIREQFFNATNFERIELKDHFRKIQLEMSKHYNTVKNAAPNLTDKLLSWDPFSHKATDWFDPEWMFGIKEGFDIVIGNPPYVRQEEFKDIKELLKDEYKDFYNGRSDLYTYFIKLAGDLLSEKGILSLIVSNKFFVRGYGKNTRKFLSESINLNQIINFGELPVFQASVDSAVLIATKDRTDGEMDYIQAKKKRDLENIRDLFASKRIQIDTKMLGGEVWKLAEKEKLEILDKMKESASTLSDLSDGNIFAGIKTGYDDAFVITKEKAQRLIRKDSRVEPFIKPWLKGRDVRKWRVDYRNLFILYIPQGKLDIKKYPVLEEHLLKYKDRLSKRALSQEWYELQQPQERFAKFFESPKIIYPDCAKEMRAAYDDTGKYGTMAMYFIPYNPLFLAILNSRLFDFYSRLSFASFGDPWNGGRIIFKTQYMQKVPIPSINKQKEEIISEKILKILSISNSPTSLNSDGANSELEKLEDSIDDIIYDIYELDHDQRRIVNDCFSIK